MVERAYLSLPWRTHVSRSGHLSAEMMMKIIYNIQYSRTWKNRSGEDICLGKYEYIRNLTVGIYMFQTSTVWNQVFFISRDELMA